MKKLCTCGCGGFTNKEFCKGHFRRAVPPINRFMKLVTITDSCWLWKGARHGSMGYGAFRFDGGTRTAHRVSWILHRGEIPASLCVLHTCDNPLCVNPDHLFLGTYADNHKDMAQKGRASGGTKGEKHHQAKLTKEQVAEIRSLYAQLPKPTYSFVAGLYGVSLQQIFRIANNQSWIVA